MTVSIAGRIRALEASLPKTVRLLLVSKTVTEEKILEAFHAGVRDFGENRVQELLGKKIRMPKELKWHMIGHLQTNKVRQVAGEAELIHSLDRMELAREIDRQAGLKKIEKIPCLIQVNSSGEKTKSGLAPSDVTAFAGEMKGLRIQLRGLMTIGPLSTDENEIRKAFRLTAGLFKTLAEKFPVKEWNILSMGMSSDYKIAIEEGSTLVRIGAAVFGERK